MAEANVSKHCFSAAIKSFCLLFFSLDADGKQHKRSNIRKVETHSEATHLVQNRTTIHLNGRS